MYAGPTPTPARPARAKGLRCTQGPRGCLTFLHDQKKNICLYTHAVTKCDFNVPSHKEGDHTG